MADLDPLRILNSEVQVGPDGVPRRAAILANVDNVAGRDVQMIEKSARSITPPHADFDLRRRRKGMACFQGATVTALHK